MFQHGIKAELTLDGGVMTGYIEDASMDLARELAEIKVWGAESVARVAGLYSINFSINGAWDPALDADLLAAALSATPLALSFQPDGVIDYTLDVWVSSYSQNHSSTDKSTYSLTLQSTGDLTRA
jgi:hypothetical protein